MEKKIQKRLNSNQIEKKTFGNINLNVHDLNNQFKMQEERLLKYTQHHAGKISRNSDGLA